MRNSPNQRSGFTLIELMVTIGIIGILIGLILPALSGARGTAMQTVALSNVRSVGLQFTGYADEHRKYPQRDLGELPPILAQQDAYEPVGDEIIIEWYPGGMIIATTDYFDQSWMWPAIVAPIDDWPNYWETWLSPSKDQELPKLEDIGFESDLRVRDMISIKYSNSFVARPEYWNGRDHQGDLSMLRPTKPHDVRFASGKVMLWDDELSYVSGRNAPDRVDGLLEAKTPMAFADGHGAVHIPNEAHDAVINAMTGESTKLHNTANGVHGRDYD